MRSKKMVKLASLSVKTLTLAVASTFLIYSGAGAAGLGRLEVLSALGQPLRAEIELTSLTKEDIDLIPKLASAEAFDQANIDVSPILSSLHFSVEERGPRKFILITSPEAMTEPFVELLVELNSHRGHLVREYSMLIDPPELQISSMPTGIEGDAVTSQKESIAIPEVATAAGSPEESIKSAKPAANLKNNQGASFQEDKKATYYQIKNGDTLSKIASRLLNYQGVSLDQILVAIHRSNPSAFIDNNMNLIRSGSVLVLPDTDEVARIDRFEAEKTFLAQSVDFNNYRNKLASHIDEMEPEENIKTNKIDSGKITAKVTELSTPINEAEDKLRLSKADLSLAEEEIIAQQKALDAANARIKELEKNAAELQKILDLQNETSVVSPQSPAEDTDPIFSAPLPVVAANVPASLPPETAGQDSPSPSLIESTLDWLSYLTYGVGLLALFASVGIYLRKRMKVRELIREQAREKVREQVREQIISREEKKTSLIDSPVETDPLFSLDTKRTDDNDNVVENNLAFSDKDAKGSSVNAEAYNMHEQNIDLSSSLHEEPSVSEIDRKEERDTVDSPENISPIETKISNEELAKPTKRPLKILYSAKNFFDTDAKIATEDIGLNLDVGDKGALISNRSGLQQAKLEQAQPDNQSSLQSSENELSTSTNLDLANSTSTIFDFDFSGIDLELPKGLPDLEQISSVTRENDKANVLAVPPELSAEAMASKLDLAVAYKQIGDKDGALELLNQVVQDGTPEQVANAKAIIDKLA